MIPHPHNQEPKNFPGTIEEEDHVGEVWWEKDTGQAVMVMEPGDPREHGLVESLWSDDG